MHIFKLFISIWSNMCIGSSERNQLIPAQSATFLAFSQKNALIRLICL